METPDWASVLEELYAGEETAISAPGNGGVSETHYLVVNTDLSTSEVDNAIQYLVRANLINISKGSITLTSDGFDVVYRRKLGEEQRDHEREQNKQFREHEKEENRKNREHDRELISRQQRTNFALIVFTGALVVVGLADTFVQIGLTNSWTSSHIMIIGSIPVLIFIIIIAILYRKNYFNPELPDEEEL
jgi:hypothetical protein